MKSHWLLKTEPTTYSWDDLVRDGQTEWTGVRNYEARNNMRKMKIGDFIFLYHSGDAKEIVGVAKVVGAACPDSTDTTGLWDCVTITPVKKLSRPISLAEVKKTLACRDMILVKKSRLSVQPVSEKEWDFIVGL